MIEIKGSKIKTALNEITVAEYQAYINALSKNQDNKFQQWIDIFVIFGASKETLYEIDTKDVQQLIKALNEGVNDYKDLPPLQSFESGTRNYVAFKDEIRLTFADLSEIKKAIQKDNSKAIIMALAVMFKDDQLGYNEHYNNAHLKLKAGIISEMNVLQFISNILFILNHIYDESEKENAVKEGDEILNKINEATK